MRRAATAWMLAPPVLLVLHTRATAGQAGIFTNSLPGFLPPCVDDLGWREERFNRSCAYYREIDASPEWTDSEPSR